MNVDAANEATEDIPSEDPLPPLETQVPIPSAAYSAPLPVLTATSPPRDDSGISPEQDDALVVPLLSSHSPSSPSTHISEPPPSTAPSAALSESFFSEGTLPSIHSNPEIPLPEDLTDVPRERTHFQASYGDDYTSDTRTEGPSAEAQENSFLDDFDSAAHDLKVLAKNIPGGYGSEFGGVSAHQVDVKRERSYALILHPVWSSTAQNSLVRYSRYNPAHPYFDRTFGETRAPPNTAQTFVTALESQPSSSSDPDPNEDRSRTHTSARPEPSEPRSPRPHTPVEYSYSSELSEEVPRLDSSASGSTDPSPESPRSPSSEIMDYIDEQEEAQMEQRLSVLLLRARREYFNLG